MACQAYFRFRRWTADKLPSRNEIEQDIQNDGYGCLSQNTSFCAPFCEGNKVRSAGCFNCLSSPVSCPAPECRTQAGDCAKSCCPNFQMAVECARCAAQQGATDEQAYVVCSQSNELSSLQLGLIIGGSVFGFILVLVVIITVIRTRRQNVEKAKLVRSYRAVGVDDDKLNRLNAISGNINASVFQDANRQLLLNRTTPVSDWLF